MATQRSISWTTAMHELRAERHPQRETLRTPDGGFNRTAIMKEACRQAQRIRTLAPWSVRVGMCLRGVWAQAKREGGKSYSPRQAARSWPASRLVANAQTGARA
jgi:hypothetical protein